MKLIREAFTSLVSIALLFAAGCERGGPNAVATAGGGTRTLSSFDRPSCGDRVFPAQTIKFEEADLARALSLYAEVSGRSIIRAGNVPDVKITFSNQTPLTAVEVLRALDTVLAAQGIATVCLGTQYVKVVPANDAPMEAGPVIELPPGQLPESSSSSSMW